MKEQKEAASKQRRRAFVTAGAAVVALLLFIIAMFMWHRSESAALRAEEQARIALVARTSAEMTPASADRDILFACQLAKDLKSVADMEWSNAGNVLLVALNRNLERTSELLRFNFDRRKLFPVDSRNPIKLQTLVASLAWHPSDQLVAFGTEGGAVILYSFTGWQTNPIGGQRLPDSEQSMSRPVILKIIYQLLRESTLGGEFGLWITGN